MRALAAGFVSPDEYVRSLILADLGRNGPERGPVLVPEPSDTKTYPALTPETLAMLQVGLDELDAGLGMKVDDPFWEELRREVLGPRTVA